VERGRRQGGLRRRGLDGFSFDVEALYVALRRGYRVREVGVAWHDSPQSRVHPLRDASRMFYDLLRIRWHDWRGRYEAGAPL
jgi:dolichyl-phosphate beta-glucosyltransferase